MTIMFSRWPRALWLLLASTMFAAPVVAQEGEWHSDDEDDNCICFNNDDMAGNFRVFTLGSRARLGVLLGEEAEVDGRSGVQLEDVPDGTPAYRAGLREGDVIVALDGDDLGDDPTAAILEMMSDRDPGDTVEVTFYRGDDQRTVQVVTDEGDAVSFFGDNPNFQVRVMPGLGDRIRDRVRSYVAPRLQSEGLARSYMLRSFMDHDMELVQMNPELGEYFDTDRGVLVAEIEDDSPLGLRTGDVILAIGGRDVRDPAHVRSILATYRDDETVAFTIMRDGRRMEVEGEVD